MLLNKIRHLCQLQHSTVRRMATLVLNDDFGRKHDYLRVSLTDRCNLRCRYCMPSEGVDLISRSESLDLEELKRITRIFVQLCGVKKIRLTGGEPMIDRKLFPLVEYLDKLRPLGVETIAMTTNGLGLKRKVNLLKNLGLDRINISLDTLQHRRFEEITRRKGWSNVLEGMNEAIEAKFESLKINCVIMKGFNDDEVVDFAGLAKKHPIEVRFIEFMPLGGNKWAKSQLVPNEQILQKLQKVLPGLKRVEPQLNNVSRVYRDPSMLGSIGFISTMTDNFCSSCNRLRITSDGSLKVCLFGKEETSLRDLMRNGATDIEIVHSIASALRLKKRKHAGKLKTTCSGKIVDLQKSNQRSFPRTTNTFERFVEADDQNWWVVDANGNFYYSPNLYLDIPFKGRQSVIGSMRSIASNATGSSFTHLDNQGKATMVNVSEKPTSKRVAKAEGRIIVGQEVVTKLREGSVSKGDALTVSRIAGIMGAKLTSHLIPLCHSIPLSHVNIEIEICDKSESLWVKSEVEANYKTGVEMESLTAVSITLLSLYDMCKSINKCMIISDIRLISKTKG